ncbi:MAG: hypothetical protein ACR2LR_16755 [Hassallia sp.]
MVPTKSIERENIKRKHLVSSLITGLVIGTILGTPIGWFAHQYYYQQTLARTLICREQNSNRPAGVVDQICGSRF